MRPEALETARNIATNASSSSQTTSNEVPPADPNQDAALTDTLTEPEQPEAAEGKTDLEVAILKYFMLSKVIITGLS